VPPKYCKSDCRVKACFEQCFLYRHTHDHSSSSSQFPPKNLTCHLKPPPHPQLQPHKTLLPESLVSRGFGHPSCIVAFLRSWSGSGMGTSPTAVKRSSPLFTEFKDEICL
jgi:hypothetical protein